MDTKKLAPGNLLVKEIVKSKSSNNEYEVYIFDNCVACTCPAGGKKQLCKHLISIIHNNLELIEKNAPEFSKQIAKVLEIKQNKNIPNSEKMKEYANIMYSDKYFASAAHDNEKAIRENDIQEIDEISDIVLKDKWLAANLYDFIYQAQRNPYSIFLSIKTDSIQQLKETGYINWQLLPEEDTNALKLNKDTEYCSFSASEKLYTNTHIAGFARGLKSLSYKKPVGDIGIKFIKEDLSINF